MTTPLYLTGSRGTRGTFAMRIGVLLFAAIAMLLLAYRMMLGVDLSDESYYLSFIDGWLKTGFRHSDALMLHQSAELLLYPLFRIFVALRPGEDGLALFNRFLYLGMSVTAGLCFGRFARIRGSLPVAVLSSVLVVCFIPFSLPSPSYNTIGMSGMICGLACYGALVETRRIRWAVASSAAWMICIFAYPTFVVVLAAFLAVVALPGARDLALRGYMLCCAGFQLLGAMIVLSAYGIDRLVRILAFTAASLQVSHIGSKLTKAAALVTNSHVFTGLCVASLIVGVVAARVRERETGRWIVLSGIVAILLADTHIGPNLFAITHDYVFLLGIAGAAFFTTDAVRRPRTGYPLAGYFLVGLLAGLVTSLTATNSIVNFAVGGFVCVGLFLLGVFPHASHGPRNLPHLLLIAAVAGLFLRGDFSFVYGEGPDPSTLPTAERVRGGVFDGLMTSAQRSRAIRQTTDFLATRTGDSIAVLGRLPGIYLMTPMRPKTLSTWDFGQQSGMPPKLDDAISRYYARSGNLPSIVLKVVDPYTRPPSASGRALMSHYRSEASLDTGLWTIDAMTRSPQ